MRIRSVSAAWVGETRARPWDEGGTWEHSADEVLWKEAGGEDALPMKGVGATSWALTTNAIVGPTQRMWDCHGL